MGVTWCQVNATVHQWSGFQSMELTVSPWIKGQAGVRGTSTSRKARATISSPQQEVEVVSSQRES